MTPSGLRAIRNLDYTMLLCRDIERMRTFYEDVMGFKLSRHIVDRFAEFQIGGTILALRLRSRPYDGPEGHGTAASVQLAFRVAPGDVSAAEAELLERGIEVLESVVDLEEFGHRTLFFADPEHNVIEIYAEF